MHLCVESYRMKWTIAHLETKDEWKYFFTQLIEATMDIRNIDISKNIFWKLFINSCYDDGKINHCRLSMNGG